MVDGRDQKKALGVVCRTVVHGDRHMKWKIRQKIDLWPELQKRSCNLKCNMTVIQTWKPMDRYTVLFGHKAQIEVKSRNET